MVKKSRAAYLGCAAAGVVVLVCLVGVAFLADVACWGGPCGASRSKAALSARTDAGGSAADERCEAALDVPKVALLFLTRGTLWHEPTWEAWFRYAAGLVPLEPLRKQGCNGTQLAAVRQHCRRGRGARGVLAAQHLFDVHVHTAPSFPGFEEGSLFHGREIATRVEAEWGTHGLIEAARQLFKAALANPRAQRFVILSESGIPLYPPTLVWQQLMSETKSRINACQHPWMDTWRWHPAMNRGRHRIPLEGWRKSSQWMGLLRSHAELFVNDTAINDLFKQYCNPANACYSDEHYVPTLLAFLGKDQETDCWGFLVNVDWSRGGAHPRTYAVEDVDAHRMKQLRIPEMCHYSGALRLVRQGFVAADELSAGACGEDSVWSDKLLDFHCPLFARKFPNETAAVVHATLADCGNRLDVVACDAQRRGGRRALQRLR